jgi:hypothetical protein
MPVLRPHHRPPLAQPAQRRSRAADQAAWRKRKACGEISIRVTVRPNDRAKLVQLGYLPPGKRDDREAVARAVSVLLDLMRTR